VGIYSVKKLKILFLSHEMGIEDFELDEISGDLQVVVSKIYPSFVPKLFSLTLKMFDKRKKLFLQIKVLKQLIFQYSDIKKQKLPALGRNGRLV